MAIVFKFVLGMTMVGSILFILIFAITPITRKIFSSRWHCYSRIAVLSFFFLPIGTASAKAFEKITYMLLKSGSPVLSDFWQEIPAPLAITAFDAGAPSNVLHGGILESILTFLPYIWLAGAVLFLILKFLQLAHFKKIISKSSRQVSDKAVLATFANVKKDMQIHDRIELISDSGISTPMLIGFVRTQLILPKTDLSENELELVFRHELTHYRHRDLWVKFAATAACAVHWFNPFVYLLANSLDRVLETSCDAEVVKNMDYDERRVYGAAILNVLGSVAGKQASVYAAFSSSQKNMKARLTAMLNEKKQSKKATAISILVMLLICAAGISVSAAAHKETGKVLPLTFTGMEHEPTYTPVGEMQYTVQLEVPLPEGDEDMLIRARINDILVAEATINPAKYNSKYWSPTIYTDESGEILVNIYIDKKLYQEIKVEATEIRTAEMSDESGVPNPLDFQEGTQPVLTSGFIWPTDDGWISAGVGAYKGHTGMDIIVPEDTPVYASNAGLVVAAEDTNVGYGKYIVIDHGNGYQTLYAHCNNLNVTEGDMVDTGQVIATVGRSGDATGFHLHFEVRYNGRIMNPEDYVDAENSSVELPQ